MEVDLPRLYQIVQQCGGLKAVIEKERWQMVADIMKIPKLAQDRITKLDDIYCKYLLPYDILSHGKWYIMMAFHKSVNDSSHSSREVKNNETNNVKSYT